MVVGFTTSHGSQVLSPKCDMNTSMATLFGVEALGLVLRVGSSKKLDPTLNTSPVNVFASNYQDPTLKTTNFVLMVS